jgi:hypothetical protein
MYEHDMEDAMMASDAAQEADSNRATTISATAVLVDYPGIEDADALVATEMTRLTMEERDQVFHDIHCISNEMEETPEQLHASLIQLQTELDRIPYRCKAAYELARSRNPAFVEDRVFRIKFLRTDLLDASKAALRLVRHFETKLQLFGPETLVKEITQDELEDGDMKNLYSGYIQTLPLRDRSGRFISLFFPAPAAHNTNVDDGQRYINRVSGGRVHYYILFFSATCSGIQVPQFLPSFCHLTSIYFVKCIVTTTFL